MAEAYLASSALVKEGFDGLRTIEEAAKAGFGGVQLFVDERYRGVDYMQRVKEALAQANLGLIVHLPNLPVQEDLMATEALIEGFRTAKVLIHYLPARGLPVVKGTRVGWENSVIGYDMGHIRKTKEVVVRDGTFFVFDMGRPLVLEGRVNLETAIGEVRKEMRLLNPHEDVMHVADKIGADNRFRGHWCVLGEGVCAELVDDIRGFGGPVVFEHEDLGMAVASLGVLRG